MLTWETVRRAIRLLTFKAVPDSDLGSPLTLVHYGIHSNAFHQGFHELPLGLPGGVFELLAQASQQKLR